MLTIQALSRITYHQSYHYIIIIIINLLSFDFYGMFGVLYSQSANNNKKIIIITVNLSYVH